jgi:hypothetical protein
MEERSASITEKHPALLVPPHIMDKLIGLILGEWIPSPQEKKHLVAHLIICEYCRTALIILLFAVKKQEPLNKTSETDVDEILAQFVNIHHEIEELEYERMGAYAEALTAEGKEKAEKRFPVLAKHVGKCASCKFLLGEMLSFLTDPDFLTDPVSLKESERMGESS